MFTLPTWACELTSTWGLSDSMVQQLKVQCEQMKLEAANAPKTPVKPQVSREDISEWAEISQEFAKALGIAAKEIGVSVNDFLMTPAGILTAAVLIWMVIGKLILGIIVGIVLINMVLWFNRHMWFRGFEEVDHVPFWGAAYKKRVRVYHQWTNMPDSALVWSVLSVIALLAYWVLIILLA